MANLDDNGNSTYTSPKYAGQSAEVGDVFKVNKIDVAFSPNLLIDDFYIAKFSGDSSLYDYPDYDAPDNEYWMHAWNNIDNFQVLINGESVEIYGNGENRCEIVCNFNAIHDDPKTGLPDKNNSNIPLSDDFLDKLIKKDLFKFVDYTTGLDMPYGWNLSEEPGDFTNTVTPGNNHEIDSQSKLDQFDADSVTIARYLSCDTYTRNRQIQLGARITLPGGKTIIGWYKSKFIFKSKAKINALAAIKYNTLNTIWSRKNTQTNGSMDQDNYYLTIKLQDLNITKVDVGHGPFGDYPKGPDFWACDMSQTDNDYYYPHWFFIWDTVSGYHVKTFNAGDRDYDLIVNEVDNAVCLTRLMADTIFPQSSNYANAYFTIYDQYGNYGKFTALPSMDMNTLEIRDGVQGLLPPYDGLTWPQS